MNAHGLSHIEMKAINHGAVNSTSFLMPTPNSMVSAVSFVIETPDGSVPSHLDINAQTETMGSSVPLPLSVDTLNHENTLTPGGPEEFETSYGGEMDHLNAPNTDGNVVAVDSVGDEEEEEEEEDEAFINEMYGSGDADETDGHLDVQTAE